MKTIIKAMLEEIYEKAVKLAHGAKQAIHDEKSKNDGAYYITLSQLEEILKGYEG